LQSKCVKVFWYFDHIQCTVSYFKFLKFVFQKISEMHLVQKINIIFFFKYNLNFIFIGIINIRNIFKSMISYHYIQIKKYL